MKVSETVKPEYLRSLHYLDNLNTKFSFTYFLFNTSDEIQQRSNETIIGWEYAERMLGV